MTTRRGFLLGLGAALVTAPSIVHACNIMPVKVMDTFHKVWINGRDLKRNPITKIIEVRESLIHGLDMAGYATDCELVRPEFLDVQSIVWSNEINKVAVSPEVDRYIESKQLEREVYYTPVIVNPSGFFHGMVHRGQTVALADETYPYEV